MKIEQNGANVIAESERHGKASQLFWPWCGANVSLLAMSYGAFVLGFGISFWQSVLAAVVGTILSFLLVGLGSIAGKRANAPTMVLSRAVFGVKGNVVPGFLSYLLFVGWETVLVSLATLATGTVFERLGGLSRDTAMVAGFILALSLTAAGGVLGFHTIMRLQRWITLSTVAATILYFALTFDEVSWDSLGAISPGTPQSILGAIIFCMTGIGVGWVNTSSDYSRYLPRTTSSQSVVGWTIFGASIVPIAMVIYGAALSGSNEKLAEGIASDPVGALTTILPTWFLIAFALIAIIGLVGGAILDLYSSGLTLITIGVPVKRHVAATFDAAIMVVGTIYIVWIAEDFFMPFQGFLITIGVPVAAWSAIFITDVLLRKRDYSESDLYSPKGRYGSWNRRSLGVMVLATFIGWGFVTNTFAAWLEWQGYFLHLIGGKDGDWAFTNIGVLFALIIGCGGHLLLSRKAIKRQETIVAD